MTGNEIIAIGIGCKLMIQPTHFGGKDVYFSPTSSDGKTRTFFGYSHELHFHESWDWLMPAVKIIGKYCRGNCPPKADELWEEIVSGLEEVNLSRTHKAVVRFFKWHNKQQHQWKIKL